MRLLILGGATSMIADKVFLNGQVVTVDEHNSINEAVAVKGNHIIAVGQNEEIKRLIGDTTEIMDLKGNSLLPGFIDSHLHIASYGTNKLKVSCKEPHINSIKDILNDLKQRASDTPKGKWIRAWGFNETKISDGRYITKNELDEVSTEHPIIVGRTCGHISMANSIALDLAGIHENSRDPDGGKIGRDENGKLNGVLIETAHMHMGKVAELSNEELLAGISFASEDFVAAGITSVHDAGGSGPENIRMIQKAIQTGKLKPRVYAMISSLNNSEQFVESAIGAGIVTGIGNEKFKLGPAKVFTDGSSSGPTVATREPYTSDPNDYGILYFDQEKLNDVLGRAHEKGFQITAHAQGDRAIEMMLNCIENALNEHPRKDHRHRIEHAGITMPDLLERMKKLGVIPIPNPPFFYEYGDGYIKNYGSRVHHMYPVRDFIDNNIMVAAGSDCPVTSYNPLLGIHVAINRKSESGQEVGINQRISILEAIKIYTYNGAYASFEENIKGSIEVGKLADLVVLNDSILDVPEDKIKDVQVEMTIIDGEVVFQKEPTKSLNA
jgi:predicted amidohydrolase YtcJ